jgi:tetratricopeptide (TPR) repeat protein
MEEIDDEIKECMKSSTLVKRFTDAFISSNKDYEVLETSDMYGFSCFSSRNDNRNNSSPSLTTFEKFRNDENWHNPASVSLMMETYSIDEPYATFQTKSSFISEIKDFTQFNYLTIKLDQNRYLSNRYVDEGMVLLKSSQIAESIKHFNTAINYDSSNSDAYFARANAYLRLNDWNNVDFDLTKSLELNPNCPATQALLKSVQQYLPKRQIPTIQSSSFSDASCQPQQDINPKSLIQKLQTALMQDKATSKHGDDRAAKESSRSSDSSSDSDSSSESDSSNTSRHRKKRKREQKHKKRKSSKHKKSKSNRKSKKRKKDN